MGKSIEPSPSSSSVNFSSDEGANNLYKLSAKHALSLETYIILLSRYPWRRTPPTGLLYSASFFASFSTADAISIFKVANSSSFPSDLSCLYSLCASSAYALMTVG